MKLAPGTIISNYEIISLLGEGGMGEVYLAKENLLDRKVAIKRLNPILTSDQAFADRFVNEARIQAKLLHSNIVGLYNFFIDRGTYYMVLEYAEGINLRELIARTGPIVEDRTLHIFRQIIAALAFAHEKQIVHRDIKPSNIIIGVGDSVKILDFGIARLLSDQHLTRTGSKLGTLFYMSPEQVMAVKDIDHRSDIYSAGVVLFEMLSGRLPFDRNTDSDYVIQHAIVSAEIPDPRTFYPHVSETTVSLMNWICVKDREQRPAALDVMNTMGGRSGVEAKPYEIPSVAQSSPPQALTPRILNPAPLDNMIFVKGGSFMMGSREGFLVTIKGHLVTLDSFYIGKFQVTQKEWLEVMGSNPSCFKGDNLPVEQVSWYDAIVYCNLLSIREGLTPCYSINGSSDPNHWGNIPTKKNSTWNTVTCDWSANGYRLPTEAEWEYAARGGNKSKGYKYSGSNDIGQVAWYDGNSGSETHTVGTKHANELGIHDMSGNVWEWCWDWHDENYHGKSPESSPRGAASGSGRVLRGGSWDSGAGRYRVANRLYSDPDVRLFGDLGFRILRAVK